MRFEPAPRSLRFATAVKIAWRELRSAPAKFLFVILAVAVGVGAITGVRGFSQAFREALLSQARVLMAGDLMVRFREFPTADQFQTLDQPLASVPGARRTYWSALLPVTTSSGRSYARQLSIRYQSM